MTSRINWTRPQPFHRKEVKVKSPEHDGDTNTLLEETETQGEGGGLNAPGVSGGGSEKERGPRHWEPM